MLREEKGITLIALIITIIILVILAAVSISAAYNSGIVNYAVNGTQAYVEGADEEKTRLASAEGLMDSVMARLESAMNVNNSIFEVTVHHYSGNDIVCYLSNPADANLCFHELDQQIYDARLQWSVSTVTWRIRIVTCLLRIRMMMIEKSLRMEILALLKSGWWMSNVIKEQLPSQKIILIILAKGIR